MEILTVKGSENHKNRHMNRHVNRLLGFLILVSVQTFGQTPTSYLLKPDRVFDGAGMHTGWAVLVTGNRITAAGPSGGIRPEQGTVTVEMKGQTLLPGLIEGHAHLLLHPYNEKLHGMTRYLRSRWPNGSSAVSAMPAERWRPGSPRSGTWARKAPGTPMRASARALRKA